MPNVHEMLQHALDHHRSGRLQDAAALYRQVLDANPDQPDALHLLGMVAHAQGDSFEADRLIARALALHPGNVAALTNHGIVLRSLGRGSDALARYDQALAITADHPEALFNRGTLLKDLDRTEEALASYDRLLAITPRHADAHYNRGNVLTTLGRAEQAEASYRSAIALRPDHADALCNLGAVLMRRGDMPGACDCYLRALDIAPDHAPSWAGFAEFLHRTEEVDERWGPRVLAALRSEHVNPQDIQRVAVALIGRTPLVAGLLQIANEPAALAERLKIRLADGALMPLLEMPLLRAVLEETIVTDFRFEMLLTSLRRVLLICTEDPAPPGLGRFASSLALQCFANEYVYAESDAERPVVEALIERTAAALKRGGTCPLLWVAVIGAYRPLHALPFADSLADGFRVEMQADDSVHALITREVLEPAAEERGRSAIPRLTGSFDPVSQAVRRQYEERPYPRWRRRGHGEGKSLPAILRGLFPHRAFDRGGPERPEILVAGCGTGSHSIQVAQRFRGATVLAVDLSLASLAYARRATEAHGIRDVQYAQADILELGDFDRRFDLIDSSGVLHHMRDPLAGWRVLRGLLKPGGFMKIGLYSRRARRDLPALRRFIAERGFEATPDGIRAARQAILTGEERKRLGRFDGIDFYSMSACRDLLFHIQEHVFSPLDIRDCLVQLDLAFLGFEFRNPAHRRAYRTRFPDDPARDSLANWEVFEEENPDTFAGMLQFWCVAEPR